MLKRGSDAIADSLKLGEECGLSKVAVKRVDVYRAIRVGLGALLQRVAKIIRLRAALR